MPSKIELPQKDLEQIMKNAPKKGRGAYLQRIGTPRSFLEKTHPTTGFAITPKLTRPQPAYPNPQRLSLSPDSEQIQVCPTPATEPQASVPPNQIPNLIITPQVIEGMHKLHEHLGTEGREMITNLHAHNLLGDLSDEKTVSAIAKVLAPTIHPEFPREETPIRKKSTRAIYRNCGDGNQISGRTIPP